MKKIIILLLILLCKITFAVDIHIPYRYIIDQGFDSKSNVTISAYNNTPFIVQFNGTNYLVVSNTAIYIHQTLTGSGFLLSNATDFAAVPFTNNAVIAWNSSIGKWTHVESTPATDTNGLASIIYIDNATNIVRQTITNQADILVSLRTNNLASIIYVNDHNSTNGLASIIYADANINTNGLASIIYIDNATNNIRQTITNQADILAGLRTNGLASIAYVDAVINTNGLASIIYVDNATNTIRQTITNQADILAGLRTNGLSSIAYANLKTNGLASIIYIDNATNNIRQTITNQADILAGLRTNGLASIAYANLKTNGLASVIYVDNSTNTIRQTITNQADILAGLRTNGLASITYANLKTNGLASVIYVDNSTNTIRQTITNQADIMDITRFTNWPTFKVWLNTNATIASSTYTKICFNSLIYEYGNTPGFGWDSTTYSYRPPIAGRYRFTFTTASQYPAGIGGSFQANLLLTNNYNAHHSRLWCNWYEPPNYDDNFYGTGTKLLDLTTNHTIAVYHYSNATTGTIMGSINSQQTIQFDGTLIAPAQ